MLKIRITLLFMVPYLATKGRKDYSTNKFVKNVVKLITLLNLIKNSSLCFSIACILMGP